MPPLYDSIGLTYRTLRRPDPRIQDAIRDALGSARSVVNIGAGTGSYEPQDRRVVAVDPSATMLRQRVASAAPATQGVSEALPLPDDAVDGALAVLTVHHWRDRTRGLQEMRRVTRGRIVILTWDPASPGFWLTDYLPEVFEIDCRIFPTLAEFRVQLGPLSVRTVPIPHDCTDGFLGAYWRRPYTYLDGAVRAAMSTFAKFTAIEAGLARLEQDLATGRWHDRNGKLLDRESLDVGYRLLVADRSPAPSRGEGRA